MTEYTKPEDAIPGEYYLIAGISTFLCEAPGVFITSQGTRTDAGNAPLLHLPNYLLEGGKPFKLGVDINDETPS